MDLTTEYYSQLTEYYSQLIDFVVTGFELERDDDDDDAESLIIPALLMMHPDGTKLRVLIYSDEELNGAGFLFVEETE